MDAEDRDGDGVGASEGESDEVERVERVFSGVVSDVICWVSEDKLARVEPDKKFKYFCFSRAKPVVTIWKHIKILSPFQQYQTKHSKLMQIAKASMNNRLAKQTFASALQINTCGLCGTLIPRFGLVLPIFEAVNLPWSPVFAVGAAVLLT